MKPPRLAPGAARELDEAAGWYEARQEGLAARFLDEFDQVLSQIRRHPSAFPRLQDLPTDLEVRQALMFRFPYAAVFLELKRDIRVIAVAHAKRQPGYWVHRLKTEFRN